MERKLETSAILTIRRLSGASIQSAMYSYDPEWSDGYVCTRHTLTHSSASLPPYLPGVNKHGHGIPGGCAHDKKDREV